jgi:hypothetical protein
VKDSLDKSFATLWLYRLSYLRIHGLSGVLPRGDKCSRARNRGLLARVQIQTKFVLVVERGLKARGYVLNSM